MTIWAPSRRPLGIDHDWSADGWTPFTAHTLNTDGAQTFTRTVAGRRGRWEPTQATGGNYRELIIHRDSLGWVNGEIEALLWGPSEYGAGGTSRPQMGVCGRTQLDTNGAVRAFAAFYDVVAGDPLLINANVVHGLGATLTQGTGAQLSAGAELLKTARVDFAQRLDAFDVSQYHCETIYDLVDGDVVDITDCINTAFNKTGVAASNITRRTGFFQVSDLAIGDIAKSAQAGVFAFNNNVRARFPYIMGLRVIGGTMNVRAYRLWEQPPDWGATLRTLTHTPTATFTIPTGAGGWGLWIGHSVSPGRYGEFGWVRARSLD